VTGLLVLPDAERLAVEFFRAQPEVVDLIGDRVYTALPAKPTWPSVRVSRWGGWALINRPLVLDEAWCQIDTWGGSKAEASWLARLMRQLADERLVPSAGGLVSGTRAGMLHDAPDAAYQPARPHWRFDLALYLRPGAAAPPRSTGEPAALAASNP